MKEKILEIINPIIERSLDGIDIINDDIMAERVMTLTREVQRTEDTKVMLELILLNLIIEEIGE